MTPEEREKLAKTLPPEQQDFLQKLITKIENNESITDEMDMYECKEKLLCNKCLSKKISWLFERNNNEVVFNCKSCGNKGLLTKTQYEYAVKTHPKQVFK